MQKNKVAQFNYIASKILLAVMILIFAVLFFSSVIYHFYPETVDSYYYDKPWVIGLGMVVFAFAVIIGGCIFKVLGKIWEYSDWAVVAFACVFWGYVAIRLMIGAQEQPGSDALSCMDIAQNFVNGEYFAVVPQGSYLSLWPFQTGLIFILDMTMRVLKTSDPLVFQEINVLLTILGIVSSFGILKEFTENAYAKAALCILLFGDFLLPIECVKVYGDVPCFSLILFSGWMFTRMFRGKQWIACGILGTISTILACVFKGNAKIFIIALLIINFLQLANEKSRRRVIQSVIVVICVMISLASVKMTTAYYEKKAGNVLGKGVPAIAYVAMGLQGRGGWNGFHSNTFMDTGYDYDKTVEISKQSIRNTIDGYKDDPLRAVRFFYMKTVHQFSYETRGAYWSIGKNWKEPRTGFATSVIDGRLKNVIDFVSNIRISIVYLIALLGTIMLFVKMKFEEYESFVYRLLSVLFFFGGFLFSLIWEAHTGYCVVYINMILPLMLTYVFDRNRTKASPA